jgi:hypothetical protein
MTKPWKTSAAAVVIGALALMMPSAHASETTTSDTRGGYVNDVGCALPTGVGMPSADTVSIDCWGSSTWSGGWTGKTIIHLTAVIHTDGSMAGDYNEWLTATYKGDDSVGGLHTRGAFSIDALGQFIARADIVGSSCAFAGSTGTFAADGDEFFGGYVGHWTRPTTHDTSPGCIPEIPTPVAS